MGIIASLKALVGTPVAVARRVEETSPAIKSVTGPINRILPRLGPLGPVGSMAFGLFLIVFLASVTLRFKGMVF